MAQDFALRFYGSAAWKKCRASYRAKVKNLCEDCLAKGLYTAGEIVHHRTPLTAENIDNPEVTLNFDNLKLVCSECHAKEHGNGTEKRWEVLSDGTVIALL